MYFIVRWFLFLLIRRLLLPTRFMFTLIYCSYVVIFFSFVLFMWFYFCFFLAGMLNLVAQMDEVFASIVSVLFCIHSIKNVVLSTKDVDIEIICRADHSGGMESNCFQGRAFQFHQICSRIPFSGLTFEKYSKLGGRWIWWAGRANDQLCWCFEEPGASMHAWSEWVWKTWWKIS